MGFDLYTLEKDAEVYFRNNCWWWRPLAEYVLAVCDDIIPEDERQYWQSNDGQIVSQRTAVAIAERLYSLIANGSVGRYTKKYMDEISAMKPIECDLCNGTGNRTDFGPPSWEKKCNGCNKCHGTGKVKPISASYPFSVENVENFADFCVKSKGFEIC